MSTDEIKDLLKDAESRMRGAINRYQMISLEFGLDAPARPWLKDCLWNITGRQLT